MNMDPKHWTYQYVFHCFKVHVNARKPEGEPSPHYVRAAQEWQFWPLLSYHELLYPYLLLLLLFHSFSIFALVRSKLYKPCKDVLLENVRNYAAAGNDVKGRVVTMDRMYSGYDLVQRDLISFSTGSVKSKVGRPLLSFL